MYNFSFIDNEKLIEVFDDITIEQNDNVKNTTIALTNKRLLFLDYINVNASFEVLKAARGIDYPRFKDIYFQIELSQIQIAIKKDGYKVILKDKSSFKFYDDQLYNLLINEIKNLGN